MWKKSLIAEHFLQGTEAVTLKTCIREVLGSNIGRVTRRPT
jgi:hypothetical protein